MYIFSSTGSGGVKSFLIPSRPPFNITANARYGLQAGSGHLSSILAASCLALNHLGTLKRAERFIAAQVIYTGASKPETSLLYEFTVGQRIAHIALICFICPAMKLYAILDRLYLLSLS